jgi:colanic acid biosynthesis glycosyl transferase WcaI
MRILVLSYFYAPDGGPAAPLFSMLCESLERKGHDVTVICTTPHYNSGEVDFKYRERYIQWSKENGVNVIRILVPSLQRSNLRKRLIQIICYQIGSSWAGLRQKYDVILLANPGFAFLLPFTILSVLRRTPAIVSVQDIYPNIGVTLGILNNRALVGAVSWVEHFCLSRSKIVQVISQSFIDPLRSLGISESKMVVVDNWVDTDLIKPLPRDNGFSREYGFSESFVVLYAGNMGFSQGLELVLRAADLLKNEPDIKFVFLGDGAMKGDLMAQAQEQELENVVFLPFQPRARLPEVLATADVSLVPLRKGIGAASLPSKCFSILASGRPLLASVDEDSDTCKLVRKSGGGICIPPGKPDVLAKTIMELKNDPSQREILGQNGRRFALSHHSPQAAANKFEQLLQAAVASA